MCLGEVPWVDAVLPALVAQLSSGTVLAGLG